MTGSVDEKFVGIEESVLALKWLQILFFLPALILAGEDVSEAEGVFEADDEIVKQAGQAQIEQFVSTKNLTAVNKDDEQSFQTLLYTPSGDANLDKFYEAAVGNLKKYAPKLRILHLYGGHTFYPKNKTSKAVQEEIVYTKNHLQAMFKAFNNNGLVVSSNLMTVMLVVDEKTQKDSDFEAVVVKQFGNDAVVDDSNEDGLELLFKLEGIDVHLYLVFLNNLEAVKKTKLPFGRTAYAQSIIKYLEPIYDELEAQSKKKIKIDDTKLFVPGVKRLNKAGKLHLEEFFDENFLNPQLKDKLPQDKLEQLVLSLGVAQLKSDLTASSFYLKAVQNLKKYAPNLKTVRLDGGYAYNPEKVNNDTIKNEITYFHDNLEAVMNAFEVEGVVVSSLKLKVYWLSSKKDTEDSGYPALLKNAFGYEPTEADVDSGKVLMTFKLHKIQVFVELHFFDVSPKGLPHGRTNYYAAIKVYTEANSENKKEDNSSDLSSKSLEKKDEVKKEDAKDEVEMDEVKKHEVEKDEVKKVSAKKGAKKDAVKKDDVKKDDAKKDDVKKDDAKKDDVKKDDVKKDDAKKDDVKKDDAKKDDAKKDEVKKEDVKTDEVKKDEVKNEGKKDDVKKDDLKKDEVNNKELKTKVKSN